MSIKATNWAFSLPLELRAKFTLLAICDHADDEGTCWPSRDRVAEKTGQSRSTVQRKIKEMQDLGILVLFERFRQDGSRTTDEIRLDLTLTPDDVRAKLKGSNAAENHDPDEAEGGVTADTGGCQPDTGGRVTADQGAVSLRPPPNEPSSKPSIEPSLTPNPFPEGKGDEDPEPEHFKEFFEGCLHWRTMSRTKALSAFRFLTIDEQALARAASPLHADECAKAKRKSLDAHKLIAEQFWLKYPYARLPAKPAAAEIWRKIEGDELAGLCVAVRIGEQKELLTDKPINTKKTEVQLDLEALAPFVNESKFSWHTVEVGSAQFAAWRERLKFWLGGRDPLSERIWTEPHDPAIHDLPRLNKDFKLRKSIDGFRVPRLWPPRRDGSWSDEGNGEAA